jgi:short-subunit dehydrogenase
LREKYEIANEELKKLLCSSGTDQLGAIAQAANEAWLALKKINQEIAFYLREELKPHGIKVTAVCPGATLTASWDGFDIDPKRIMEATDVAKMVLAASQLSPMAVVEDIILRPQLGDL